MAEVETNRTVITISGRGRGSCYNRGRRRCRATAAEINIDLISSLRIYRALSLSLSFSLRVSLLFFLNPLQFVCVRLLAVTGLREIEGTERATIT